MKTGSRLKKILVDFFEICIFNLGLVWFDLVVSSFNLLLCFELVKKFSVVVVVVESNFSVHLRSNLKTRIMTSTRA